ncbi:glutamate receptor 2.3-like [Juglans microcarpa x Juglans regia]|uniref:glutamate receptor 2.3-like n=1 Tax=Juglans microcarpa x Juglans regia TaxID=2249226 RepID=UPI001B7ED44D|nr:glutamate receptor 2.3-like [Juglans microcarpa x Juglans regia]
MLAKAQINTTLTPVNVGVILDMDSWYGKMGFSCIQMALSDFYASNSHYKTRLVLHVRDSKRDVVEAAVAAQNLIKNTEVQAIIGPQNSMQANFVISLGQKAQVPIISFSATSPSLTSLRSEYFFRAAQNDSAQVKAISAVVKAFGWKQAVPIYVDNEYGEGIIPFLIDALQDVDARVPYRSVIAPLATDDEIGQELYKLMTMQTRVFIVHMSQISLSSRLFSKAKEIGMMSEGYVWIITNGIANPISSIEPSILDSMQGVLGVKTYIPKTKELENFAVRWKRTFQQENPNITNVDLNVFGLWAYDAASALATAVEKVGGENLGSEQIMNASSNLISQNGPKLREVLLEARFRGIAGEFSLPNGQLRSSTFQIINLNDNGERVIAFWTPENGLGRKLNSTNTVEYSTSMNDLGPIIWPGDQTSVPKGWEIPTNGKKMRIGVPVSSTEYVNFAHDPSTNTTHVTGYCIDIFNAVMESLPYTVRYEFIPFAKPDGRIAGTYNDLFDAVVGDTTIIANRSKYVDFTLPYTESGVSMIVPLRDSRRRNAWIFLKPLSWDLWITSFCFFVFIGFVVWLLEHRVSDDFRGPPSHQIGTSLWYAFSTMVFAQREIVISNCTRFVVIIWVFVVLILTQSYTASLASLLTVQQLQPTVTDVNKLIKNGEKVGYHRDSFVSGILKEMKFKESQLKEYESNERCDELLSKGSANGGIAAAFDETPYMKLFLRQYCSKYTMAASIYKTDGFGFVFPIGSPLVTDISRAILKVTEGEKMKEIESAWLQKQTNCPDSSNTQVSSDSLSLANFWGLFLIAGVASLSALIFSISMFLYKERQHIFIPFDPDQGSIWSRLCHILMIFDGKDLSSHTFRRKALQDQRSIDSAHCAGASEASTNIKCFACTSSYSAQTDNHPAIFLESPETPASREYGDPSTMNCQLSQLATSIELVGYPNQERKNPIEIDLKNS